MLIVQNNRKLMKSNLTSKGTISYSSGMGSFFIYGMKFVVLLGYVLIFSMVTVLSLSASLTDVWLCRCLT